MPSEDDLTPEAFADWLTPRQALEILDAVLVRTALSKQTLIDRLRGGMVQAASNHSVFEGDRSKAHRLDLYKIPAQDWDHASVSDTLWITGDTHYSLKEFFDRLTARHFDVRFEPQGVRKIVGLFPKPAASPPALPDDSAPKGPRVSDAHLRAWFEFYKKVHTEVEDTEDRAAEFARICFPGKSVSRDRIRALRGSLKRGPKKKSDSAE